MPFDREEALARVGGDPELLAEIAALFLKDLPRGLGELRQAVAARHADAVERHAHALKGAVSNFGAHEATAAAQELEIQARAGSIGSLTKLEHALDRLRPELESLCRAD
ncbi:MAG: Hpt domain-containing protein [Acidobacteriota bacterium]|nr:Hpt domain-containing protein [Acidobacteriota bacterium]